MKSRTLTCISPITLLAALAPPVQLVAQEQQAPTFTVLYKFPVLSDGYGPSVLLQARPVIRAR
jgi:hypothetical protein